MPRISETNPRFRSKAQICADVATILETSLHYGTKFAVLAEITWVWSEFDGKYSGCQYWSPAAWKLRNSGAKLVHEHLVPKSVIIDRLMSLKKPSRSSVKKILETLCIGVVVTTDEDRSLNALGLRSKMPDDWDGKNPRARYEMAGLEIHDAHCEKAV